MPYFKADLEPNGKKEQPWVEAWESLSIVRSHPIGGLFGYFPLMYVDVTNHDEATVRAAKTYHALVLHHDPRPEDKAAPGDDPSVPGGMDEVTWVEHKVLNQGEPLSLFRASVVFPEQNHMLLWSASLDGPLGIGD